MSPIENESDDLNNAADATVSPDYSDTFAEIIRYAMEQEEEEEHFYQALIEQVQCVALERVLLAIAREEQTHRQQLAKILHRRALPDVRADGEEGRSTVPMNTHLPQGSILSDADSLLLAIRREQTMCNLYQDLARVSHREEARKIFVWLAQQENHHRLLLERELARCEEDENGIPDSP